MKRARALYVFIERALIEIHKSVVFSHKLWKCQRRPDKSTLALKKKRKRRKRKITIRGNAARYTCKSTRASCLCNRSPRPTIEPIAVFKVTFVERYEFHKIEERSWTVLAAPFDLRGGKKSAISPDKYSSYWQSARAEESKRGRGGDSDATPFSFFAYGCTVSSGFDRSFSRDAGWFAAAARSERIKES